MRDDVDGGVCVVPAGDDVAGSDDVLLCPAASAVAVADGVPTGPGTWSPHPSLHVDGRPVAVATGSTARAVVAAVNGGTPVEEALTLVGSPSQGVLTAA